MTARGVYEAILIEMNKTNAPDILLEDFNYLFNKAINLYVNKRYNIYDVNQQTTDDLRVLKATSLLVPEKTNLYGGLDELGRAMEATYECILPQDYLHILNCICYYKVNKTYRCYNAGDIWRRAATRLTADAYSQVLDNYWNRPTYKRPYYWVHETNIPNRIELPTNPLRNWKEGVEDNLELKYYIGGITPNASNYQSLLNLTKLNGLYRIGEQMRMVYVLYPIDEEITLWDSGQYMQIATTAPVLLGNYYMISTIQPTAGDPNTGYIYVKGKTTSFTTHNIRIGNDFQMNSLTDAHLNREISENGVNTSYGQDAFGNQIYAVKDNMGIPTNTVIMSNDGEYVESSFIERAAQVRYGNPTLVRLEIRYGTDSSLFSLHRVYIDYIKAPQYIRLTQEQLDITEDTSQVLEFPDYVCQEIINELVHVVLENIGDPRLQTHPVVSLSIANPAQQLTEPVAQLLPT